MSEEITAAKRPKIESNAERMDVNAWTIKAILPDELDEPIPRCFVYVATLNDMKSTSKVMSELCQVMPLKTLNHLKRVNKSKLIVCSASAIREFFQQNLEKESIQTFLFALFKKQYVPTEDELADFDEIIAIALVKFYMQNLQLSDDTIEMLSEKIEMVGVAARPPILSWQYADVIKDWPCKFHPNKQLEQQYLGETFSNDETAFHKTIIEICGYLCEQLEKETCGIAVDPRTKSIVAVGFDAIDRHPLMHCAMVLIDAVARSQNGGAWNSYLVEKVENGAAHSSKCDQTDDYTMFGISSNIRQLILSKFSMIKFGAEHVKFGMENRENYSMPEANVDNLSKYGPYLCTGYDVYLWREPCVMCAMSLTHSRTRTTFFHQKQPNGALGSLTKLQSFKALNHHFPVFEVDTAKNTKIHSKDQFISM